MTTAQTTLYWREWAACRRALRAINPQWPDHRIAAMRHDFHRRALGQDKSHRDFSNRDFDLILGAFRSISAPADLDPQLRAQDMPRRRLLWRIRRMAPAAYTAAIAQDKFHTTALETLGIEQLTQLRNTLAARAARLHFSNAEGGGRKPRHSHPNPFPAPHSHATT
jgi:hypothetical protein